MTELPEWAQAEIIDVSAQWKGFWERVLQPQLPVYEQIIGVNLSDELRNDLITAAARYSIDEQSQANQVENEREERIDGLRRAEQRERAARAHRQKIKAMKATMPTEFQKNMHDFEMEAYLRETVAVEMHEKAQKEQGKRGRPSKDADKNFLLKMADFWEHATGKWPTIVTENTEYRGPFIELLRAVQTDVRDVIKKLNPERRDSLSTDIGRYAKKHLPTGRDRKG